MVFVLACIYLIKSGMPLIIFFFFFFFAMPLVFNCSVSGIIDG